MSVIAAILFGAYDLPRNLKFGFSQHLTKKVIDA